MKPTLLLNIVLLGNIICNIDAQILVVDITSPRVIADCNTHILESELPGNVITQCKADDFNDAMGSFVIAPSYELLSGNIDDTFSIDVEGYVTLEKSVDRESIPFYNITVRVSDGAIESVDN